MKAGDLVVYREGEREFNALVFHVHEIPEHMGEDGEPLLHLVIVDENPPRAGIDKNPPPVPPQQRIRQVLDVVHESHEYSDEFKKKQGLPQGDDAISAMRAAAAAGPGRWSEIFSAPAASQVPVDDEGAGDESGS